MKAAKHELTIEPVRDEAGNVQTYRLFGYVRGQRYRKFSRDLSELEEQRGKLLETIQREQQLQRMATEMVRTWIGEERVRDAEAAILELPPGLTLRQCVIEAKRHLGTGAPVNCTEAVKLWDDDMNRRRLENKTIEGHISRVKRIIRDSKCGTLQEFTSSLLKRVILRDDVADYTQLGDARSAYAFFNFCVSENLLRRNPLEPKVIEDLKERAEPKHEPEIFVPEQLQRLLNECCASGNPTYPLLWILCVDCFMRPSEAKRLSHDNIAIHRDANGKTDVVIHLKGRKVGSKWRDIPVSPKWVPLFLECLDRNALVEPVARIGEKVDKSSKEYRNAVRMVMFNRAEWDQIRARAGFCKLAPTKYSNRFRLEDNEWGQDVLRHSGMSYLYQELRDTHTQVQLTDNQVIDIVTSRAGNSEAVAFKHYLRRLPRDAWKEYRKITATLPPRIDPLPVAQTA